MITFASQNIKIMKEKTIKQLQTAHNRLARLNNVLDIDESELNEDEVKELAKIKEQAFKLTLKFSKLKMKIFNSRSIEASDVW